MKITQKKFDAIKNLLDLNTPIRDICDEVKTSNQTVYKVKKMLKNSIFSVNPGEIHTLDNRPETHPAQAKLAYNGKRVVLAKEIEIRFTWVELAYIEKVMRQRNCITAKSIVRKLS